MLATRTLAPSEPALADDQHSLMRSAFAHLAPGVLIAVFYLAMMFIAIPVELGDLLRRGWRRNDRLSLEGVVPGWFRAPLAWHQLISWTLLMLSLVPLAPGLRPGALATTEKRANVPVQRRRYAVRWNRLLADPFAPPC